MKHLKTKKHLESTPKKKLSVGIVILLVVLVGGIGFSGWKLYGILSEYRAASVEYSETSDAFTQSVAGDVTDEERETVVTKSEDEALEDVGDDAIFRTITKQCPFTVGFDSLWSVNTDVVAWISSPGTVIDYPVVHGETNDTYLYNTWKGTWNVAGSIFTNYRVKGDLSDNNTIIYGHNMKNGAMFHTLKNYETQSYYENHPYIWYVTPEGSYLLYIMAGYVTTIEDTAYKDLESEEAVRTFIRNARPYSTFTPTYIIDGMDADYIAETAKRIVVLSTCSYEYDNARYVLLCVPLLSE